MLVPISQAVDERDQVTPTYYVIFTGFTLVTSVVSVVLSDKPTALTRALGPVPRPAGDRVADHHACDGLFRDLCVQSWSLSSGSDRSACRRGDHHSANEQGGPHAPRQAGSAVHDSAAGVAQEHGKHGKVHRGRGGPGHGRVARVVRDSREHHPGAQRKAHEPVVAQRLGAVAARVPRGDAGSEDDEPGAELHAAAPAVRRADAGAQRRRGRERGWAGGRLDTQRDAADADDQVRGAGRCALLPRARGARGGDAPDARAAWGVAGGGGPADPAAAVAAVRGCGAGAADGAGVPPAAGVRYVRVARDGDGGRVPGDVVRRRAAAGPPSLPVEHGEGVSFDGGGGRQRRERESGAGAVG